MAFVIAWLAAAAWGSVVQTQFNLNALTALGVEIAPALRLQTTLQDLLGFGPPYAGIVLLAWLPAFAVAAWLARRQPAWRLAWFGLAAGVGLVAAIRSIDAAAPMPVLIDATRGIPGLLAMTAGSVLAGVGFAHWTRADGTAHEETPGRPKFPHPPGGPDAKRQVGGCHQGLRSNSMCTKSPR